ncbi:hypothetical protein PDESU_05307 [Pontiella desulfatans]|uniref:P/Homo B domain-containing protein n=1 Tax=Pontiella desulfatans TaxID=2750659 RepID=A0A6C2UBQ8_PONDE|nr:hypothetical protein [Pontiella desulfatans]VGO16716.1 hypothetical protein PDESU_05307 [Pontiella desulfatans]
MKPFLCSALLRYTPGLLAALLILAMPFTAQAEVAFTLDLWHGYSFYYGDAALVATNPAPATYHRVESHNGLIWQNAGNNNDSSSSNLSLTNDLAVLMNEVTNGLWTLTLNFGDASQQIYTFSVSAAGVNTGLFGTADVTSPADGTTATTNQPNIQWTGPNFPEVYVQVAENDFPYAFGGSATLPGTTTNWTPPAPLSAAEQSVLLIFRTNGYAGVTFTTPTGGTGLTGWSAVADLNTYDYSSFTVPGAAGNSALGNAVDAPELTWTTGGDADWFAQDYEVYDITTNAAQSGFIGVSGTSWIETTVQGPGTLEYAWAIFADEYDYAEVEWNGFQENYLEWDWGWDTGIIYLDPGPNTIRWTFYNDDPTAGDYDAAFLDEVVYTPEPPEYDVEFNLRLQRNYRNGTTYYLAFPDLPSVYPPAATVHEVESPNQLFTGGEGSSSSANLTSLDAVLDECTNGVWTLYLDRGSPYEEQYTFSMSVLSLSTNDFPPVVILDPIDGASGVSTDPNYMWFGPPSFDSLFVLVRDNEANSTVGFSSLSALTASWDGPTLAEGTNTFSATYTSNNFMGLDFTEPSGGYPLSSWFSTAEISTAASSTFIASSGFVPLPVTIFPPVLIGGDLGLSFPTQSGATHFVEWSTNLVTGPWLPATNFPGDGTTNMVTLPATHPAAYFKVETE